MAYANHDTTVGLYRVNTLKWFLFSWTHLSVFAVDDVMFSFSLQDVVLTQLFSIHFFLSLVSLPCVHHCSDGSEPVCPGFGKVILILLLQ